MSFANSTNYSAACPLSETYYDLHWILIADQHKLMRAYISLCNSTAHEYPFVNLNYNKDSYAKRTRLQAHPSLECLVQKVMGV